MAEMVYLASTVVMGLLGVGVFVLATRTRRWHHYTPQAAYDLDAGGGSPRSPLAKLAGSTGTWTVLYVLLVLGFMAGAMVYASGAITGPTVIAALGATVAIYLVGGVYFAMREHGRPSAQATAGSVITVGMLSVVAISAKLVLIG